MKFLHGNFTGIGKKRASTLIKEFGIEVTNILESPNAVEIICDRLCWSKQVTQNLVEQWRNAILPKRIEFLLIGAGLSNKQISKLKDHYGEGFVDNLTTNPYSITKVSGVTFLTADKFALKKGIVSNAPVRIWAAAEYVIKQASLNGNCFMLGSELCDGISKLLRVSQEAIRRCLNEPIPANSSAVRDKDGDWWSLDILHAEKQAASHLVSLLETPKSKAALLPEEWDQLWRHFQMDSGILLTEEQKAAVRAVIFEKVIIITGNPGTGKTTILKAILAAFDYLGTSAMSLCAPTGKAARRMAEATGRETSTVHRLLNLNSEGQTYSHLNPLPADVIAVDEVSMLDIELFSLLISAVKRSAQVVLIGDSDQLPSVGPGRVLADLLDADIPQIRLTQPQRQAQKSLIVRLAHDINRGHLPELPTEDSDEDVWFFEARNCAEAQKQLDALVRRFNDKEINFDGIKVLSPQKKGDCGVLNLNTLLQGRINPPHKFKAETAWGKGVIRVDDRLIQLQNDYQLNLMNGEDLTVCGLKETQRDQDAEKIVELATDDGKEFELSLGEMNMQLSYALTIHKSQGSEWETVVIFCLPEQLGFFSRRMFYTGLTRAKRLAVIIGDRASLRKVISRNYDARRKTKLVRRIEDLWKQKP